MLRPAIIVRLVGQTTQLSCGGRWATADPEKPTCGLRHEQQLVRRLQLPLCWPISFRATSAACRQFWTVASTMDSGCRAVYSTNHDSIPSHSDTFPGGTSCQPSSSTVQFDLALLRAHDVVTQFVG